MLVNVTAEELECKAFLNDVGICFVDDNVFEGSLTKGDDRNITNPLQVGKMLDTLVVPISPEQNPVEFPETMFEPLNLLSETVYGSAPTVVTPTPETRAMTGPKRRVGVNTQSAASRSRKRKRHLPQNDIKEDQENEDGLDRRKRNREHAKASRHRKKLLTSSMLQGVEDLKEETKKLRQELYASIGEEKVLSILNAKKSEEQEIFLIALKNPRNRIVDGPTLRFLKALRKRMPTDV